MTRRRPLDGSFRIAVSVPLLALVAAGGSGCASKEERGAALYAEHCASCHGTDGRGDPRRSALEPGLDLVASELVSAGARAQVYRAISGGYGTMPGFAHRMELGELDDVTTHVMALAPDEPAPAE